MSHKIDIEIIGEKEQDTKKQSLFIEMNNRFSADIFYNSFDLTEVDLGGYPDGVITKTYKKKEVEEVINKFNYLIEEPYDSIRSVEKKEMANQQMMQKIEELIKDKNINYSDVVIETIEKVEQREEAIEKIKEKHANKIVIFKIRPTIENAKKEIENFFNTLKQNCENAKLIILRIS